MCAAVSPEERERYGDILPRFRELTPEQLAEYDRLRKEGVIPRSLFGEESQRDKTRRSLFEREYRTPDTAMGIRG